MNKWFLTIPIIAIQLIINLANASNGKRVALVIGNDNYQNLKDLSNAKNDANAMSQKLKEMDFEVIKGINLSRKQTLKKLSQFDKAIRAGDDETIALFFYAGHGLEINKKTYLIPVDANIKQFEDEVNSQSVALDTILKRLKRTQSKLNLVILDACRDNPLQNRGYSSIQTRSLADDMSHKDKQITSKGRSGNKIQSTFIAFGTSPEKKALDSDGYGDNGLFTKHILKNINKQGYNIADIFNQVRIGVYKESHGKQLTWQSSSMVGDFFFRAGDIHRRDIVKRPKWLIPVIVTAATLLLFTFYILYQQRRKIAWANSVVLSGELKRDNSILNQEIERSHLIRDQIVGYLKDLKTDKIITLIQSNDKITLGREASSDFVIDDGVISTKHVEISYNPSNKTFLLQDLDSSNGVWLSETEQLPPNKQQTLKDGQVFYLANDQHPMVLVKSTT